ncbi:MAG: hypothetical protein HY709_08095 [Candidatus Latescibacteria bacterium]|nr:hypothetical protein [Candidatus Latescibacterota bacterium]
MHHWYAVHTKPLVECEVEALLIQQGIEVFLPKVRSITPRRRRPDAPFFPRYLFLRVDLERVAVSTIQWLPGVHRILAFGGRPVVVPEEVIVEIKERLNEIEAAGGLAVWHLRQGERVRVVSGPFRDVEGLFDETVRAGERVRLLLRLLGRVCTVEVGIEDVEPLRVKIPRRTRGKGRWIRQVEVP